MNRPVHGRLRPALLLALLTAGLGGGGLGGRGSGGGLLDSLGLRAAAQVSNPDTDGTVRSLIPNVIALRRPAAAPLAFDLSAANFPPIQYPARYLAAPQDFSVFSSAGTPWTVQLQIDPHPDTQGRTIPADLVSYRVNGGPWIKAMGVPQIVMSSAGPTPGWMPLRVEVALDLAGGELGGDYAFDLTFTAQVLP